MKMLEIVQGPVKEERMKVNHLNAKSFLSDEITIFFLECYRYLSRLMKMFHPVILHSTDAVPKVSKGLL